MSGIPSINPDLAKLGLSRDLSGAGNTGATGGTRDKTKLGKGAGGLGVEDFLALMVAQFKNQDPTKPVDNAQFIAQLASFSTVAGIDSMQKSLTDIAGSFNSGQTLQAASLLGRTVLVNSPTGYLTGGGSLGAALDVPAGSQRAGVQVVDAAGTIVRTIDLGAPRPGLAKFSWDGRDGAGNALPAGQYTFQGQVLVNGQAQAATTFVQAVVQSVTLGGGAGKPITVSLVGLGDVSLGDVKSIS